MKHLKIQYPAVGEYSIYGYNFTSIFATENKEVIFDDEKFYNFINIPQYAQLTILCAEGTESDIEITQEYENSALFSKKIEETLNKLDEFSEIFESEDQKKTVLLKNEFINFSKFSLEERIAFRGKIILLLRKISEKIFKKNKSYFKEIV